MIGEEGSPSLRGRLAEPDHVLADAGLADVNAELQQLAVDARSTPERVVAAHGADQLADVARNSWPTGLPVADLPPPEKAEAPPMPGNSSQGLDDQLGGRNASRARLRTQPRPQEPILGGELRLLDRTTQDAELVPKREVLQLEGGSGFGGCRRDSGQQAESVNSQT